MASLNIASHLERLRTEPGLKKNVIALVALLLAAAIAGGWILSNQRFTVPGSDRFELSAEFEAVPGVAPGNGQEVRIAGVIVGQITGAKVNDEGRAQLTMELDPGTDIHEDARLVLRPKSPLNEMYVEISPGTSTARKLRSGETLPVTNTHRPIQVDEVLASLDDSTRSALTALLREADTALASSPKHLPQGLDQLSLVSEQLKPVAEELAERQRNLRRLVTAASEISSAVGAGDARLARLAADLDTTLQSVGKGQDDLRGALSQLPDLADKLQKSTSSVSRLSQQLDPTLRDVSAASDVLPGALEKLGDTSDALDVLLDSAGPALKTAKPVLTDLRPVATDARAALPRLENTTARLDPVTAQLLSYLPDLGAFFINTRSVTSLRDANGGILRGLLEITPDTLPNGRLTPSALEGILR